MRKVTATEKYRAVNEGQMPQAEFVRQMRLAFPQHITQFNGYEDTVSILKTRGVLSETKLAEQLPNTVSIDSIQRAVDIELTAAGHDPVTCSDVEAQDKAKEKALKNLKKDPLHYYNLLAKESSKVDKNDKMKETKPGAKDKDTFNDMKKAELKEDVDRNTKSLREITMDLISYLKKEKGADNNNIKDFIKTHFQDIRGMSLDQIGDEYDQFIYANYESPSDHMQESEVEEEETVDEGFNDNLSAEDLSDLAQFFYSYAISTETDGYTDVAKHIDQAARELSGIEAPSTAPGMEENLNERVGGLQEFISLIEDRAAENDTPEAEEAEEVVYAIGDHYNFGVDIMHAPKAEAAGPDPESICPECDGSGCDHCDGTGVRKLNEEEIDEKKGKDHDGDGDVDKDDYMAAKDKAIKKATGNEKKSKFKKAGERSGFDMRGIKENLKAIISKVLEEQVVNEAATAELSKIADDYAGFDGMKSAIIALENIVTDIEQYYEKTRTKIQKVYDTLGEIRNEEGLKVGGFIAPAIEQAFLKDLRPVTKTGFTKGLDQPKVRTISQADIDAHNSGERPLGEEAPKETVFTPVMETKKKK